MKKILLSIILLCGGMLTGCVQLVDMTEEQNNIIAEYMAGSYLKQTDYEENLVYPNVTVVDNHTSNVVNSTAIIPEKNATTESATSSTNTEDKTLEVNVIDSGLNNETDANTITSKDKDNSDNKEVITKKLSINELINYKNFNIKYTNYEVLDSYQSKMDGNYLNLEPNIGNKLLVVNFKVKNLSDKANNFNLIGKKIQYKLSASKVYFPMLTLLNEDLQYIDVTIKSGATYNAVLVYEVPKNIDKSKISLSISFNSNSTDVAMN